MREFILCLMMLMASACSLNHGRPIANLQYSKTEKIDGSDIYQVYFYSDVELLGLFKSYIGQGLVCSLTDDLDFSQAHHIKQSGFGFVEKISESSLVYRADMIFSESESGQGGEKYLQGETLSPLLMKRDYVSCVFRVHTTTYKTYFSNILRIPNEGLLKAGVPR